MEKRGLLVIALAMLVAGFGGLFITSTSLSVGPSPLGGFTSNGQRIFFTATDSSGRPILYRGGMMMRMACANCHGPDGQGLRTPMFVSPNITYQNLTSPEGMLEPDGGRGHTYTDETIKRAITQGVDPAGEPLQWPMPRWRMSERDLDDLIAFLKTLP